MRFFDPIISDSDANPHFLIVRDKREFTPASAFGGSLYTFPGDSNRAFVQDFQTNGLAARI
jgi:hypothetical protein